MRSGQSGQAETGDQSPLHSVMSKSAWSGSGARLCAVLSDAHPAEKEGGKCWPWGMSGPCEELLPRRRPLAHSLREG